MSSETIVQNPPGPVRVLLVDDSKAILAIVRRAVEKAGYSELVIETAPDGQQALSKIKPFAPDLVISDYYMPNLSGMDMLKALRRTGMDRVRVGFVSTESSPQCINEAYSLGALFWVTKPFTDEVLAATVRKALPPEALATRGDSTSAREQPVLQSSGPVLTQALCAVVESLTPKLDFTVDAAPKMTPTDLAESNLLGLYASGQKAVAALAIMDLAALCAVGACASGQPPASTPDGSFLRDPPTDQMRTGATEFLRRTCAALHLGHGVNLPRLAQISVVPRSLAKLQDVLGRDLRRSDYVLNLRGYGRGRVTFIAL